MTKTFTRWEITDHLLTKEDVRLYLEACAEEDPRGRKPDPCRAE